MQGSRDLSPTIICSHGSDGTTESGQRRSDKNAVINYYVIYHIIQLVIAAP